MHKSMNLKYESCSEPLHIFAKQVLAHALLPVTSFLVLSRVLSLSQVELGGVPTSPQNGIKSSFSIALICTTSRRILVSANTNLETQKSELIPL